MNEPWWTATAKRADIVFPATTPYEREDVGKAMGGDHFVFHMPKLIEPIGKSKNDFTIFSELAKRLKAEEEFTEKRSEKQWITHLYDDFQKFLKLSASMD